MRSSYEQHKQLVKRRDDAISRAGRDIGELPPVADQKRRDACERSFRLFCETYFAGTFCKPWSDDHLRVLAKAERAILFGDLFAMAMPRGSGKTSIVVASCLWALLTGEHGFVTLIGSDEGAAAELLDSIKTELETNDLLADDFPEVCVPIRKLDGIAQRRLLYRGEPIRMEFTAKEIVLPNLPDSPSYEAVVRTSGITGRIRGMSYKRGDGRTIRPSLVIIDDPQTDESAGSVTQCATREKVLAGAILGLSGPGQKISGIMPCTVIRPGDMADKILDRTKYPQWNGERTKMVYAWPTNGDRLQEYRDMRADAQRAGAGADEYNAFWKEHQTELESGASVAWPDRKDASDVSAIQHAVNLRMDIGEIAFQAEYQNDPIDETNNSDLLSADEICRKVNGYERGTVPGDANYLTAFVDVQGTLLYWCVVAWRSDFTGYVIDYGGWPEQRRAYFTLADAAPKIGDKYKGGGLEAQIFAALGGLIGQLCGKEWPRDGGGVAKVDRCHIDANWHASTRTVYSWCRQSPFLPIILPTHGRGVKASQLPMHLLVKKDVGERAGLNWIRKPRSVKHEPIPYGTYDTNFWKSFAHTRLTVPMGDPGCLSLFKADAAIHRMFADQLHAEFPTPVEVSGGGRKVNEWQARPNHPDNHFLDCLTGNCVAASMLGATLPSDVPKAKKERKPLGKMGT
jgi:hypothetical protein